ncbi:MAG: LiaF-related protein [Clostridia bacterium]|nr:LiaF-related protein [Clostridia bacterium]
MKKLERYFLGVLFIVVGVLLALKIADVITFNLWNILIPAVALVIGLWLVVKDYKNITGYLLILIAAAVFIRYTLRIDFDLKYIIAAALIIVGVVIMLFSFSSSRELKDGTSHIVIFGGKEDRITDPNFKGCTTFCMFGGHDIDLRSVTVNNDIILQSTVLFGGITIILPENVNIRINSMPIFGGIENKTTNTDNNAFTVSIKALTIFGGIEIKN